MNQTEKGSTASGGSSRRVMAYCHDGVGLGHLRRTLNICEHIGHTHAGTSFLVATGSPYFSLLKHPPTLDFVKLPSIEKVRNDVYRPKYLSCMSADKVMEWRSEVLLRTAQVFAPDLLLVDKAPLGVCNELLDTLRWVRRHMPATRIVFGMRDIEDTAEATIAQWTKRGVQRVLEECFDEIWVYGMESVFDVASEYRLSPTIRDRLRFLGYVTRTPCGQCVATTNGKGRHVLVTVGGGTDGEAVLDAYLCETAGRLAERGIDSTVIGGPDLPERAATRLRDIANAMPLVRWLGFVPCLGCQIRRASMVVSMGGYNTLCEVAALGTPTLVIPRKRPRLEQTMRATRWERLGIIDTLDADTLTPERLARSVESMIDGLPTPPADRLDMSGLDRVAERFEALLGEPKSAARAVRRVRVG